MTSVSHPTAVTGITYTVTFNRSVVNCVVQAVPGFGDTSGGGGALQVEASPFVLMDRGNAAQLDIYFLRHNTSAGTDTSFLIAAFC